MRKGREREREVGEGGGKGGRRGRWGVREGGRRMEGREERERETHTTTPTGERHTMTKPITNTKTAMKQR